MGCVTGSEIDADKTMQNNKTQLEGKTGVPAMKITSNSQVGVSVSVPDANPQRTMTAPKLDSVEKNRSSVKENAAQLAANLNAGSLSGA